MNKSQDDIVSPQDAILFCDYLAKFTNCDASRYYGQIASVIRELMLRLEQQAMKCEQMEAKGGDK